MDWVVILVTRFTLNFVQMTVQFSEAVEVTKKGQSLSCYPEKCPLSFQYVQSLEGFQKPLGTRAIIVTAGDYECYRRLYRYLDVTGYTHAKKK